MSRQSKIQVKLVKNLLEIVVLQLLSETPMHGYQVIKEVRKEHGVYFGPSTIYPLLQVLEKKRFIKGKWEMYKGRPRRIYQLTVYGRNHLLLSLRFLTNLRIDITKESSTAYNAVENIPSTPA